MAIQEAYFYIYMITNNLNGKTYFGKHRVKNFEKDSYMGSGVLIKQAIKKYGIKNFSKRIIISPLDSNEEANYYEKKVILLAKFIGMGEYNLTLGGDGGNFTDEIKQKISKKLKGRKISEEQKKKISEFQKIQKKTEGHLKKIADANRGKKRSEEARKKMSDWQKGRKLPEETIKKMSRKHTDAEIEKRKKSLLNKADLGDHKQTKTIYLLDENKDIVQKFNCLRNISDYLNISISTIQWLIRNFEKDIKSRKHKNFKICYKSKYEEIHG